MPQIVKKCNRVSEALTSWVSSEDISSDFIIKEDDEGVREGTEPPQWPKGMDGQSG